MARECTNGTLEAMAVEHASMRPSPHAVAPEEIVIALGTDAERGLATGDAAARLAAHGPNLLSEAARPRYAAIALRQVVDPLVALLVIAAAVSAAIGESLEAAAIGVIVVLNAGLGFFQEAAAERAITSLRRGFPRRASVVRDGRELEVSADEIVPGDIVVLREGDAIPADARLLPPAGGIEVDESTLTGESLPVEKDPAPVDRATPLADRRSMVFAGTGVTRGRARAVVTATGMTTELGRIAQLAGTAVPPPTPLQARLGRLARVLAAAGVGLTVALGAAMLAQGASLHEAFLTGVSVAVAAVPEGLLATVTIALALGAGEMARRGAIVRRLAAIETIGEVTTACVDKTGTLTENRMRVAAVRPAAGRSAADVLAAAALASTAELVDEGGTLRVVGDPVEGAVLLAALEQGLSRRHLVAGQALVAELPFSSERRRMAAVYDGPEGRRLLVKGAPEVLLERSTLQHGEGDDLATAAQAWAEEGFRVLAVAERQLDSGRELDGDLERELVPLGLIALHDPVREGVGRALQTAARAGVRVAMLTGDHAATAGAVAATLGLRPEDVHARVTPADKLAIVEREQTHGEVVLVTGDGVNDAPALRQADVGVAMGRGGTEAAREAADIVLVDDAFPTIVAAIREGRRIGENVRKVIAFLLSANLGEVVLFAIAVAAGLGAPMAVVQVLTVNVLTDGLPALALARDPSTAGAMERRPRPRGSFLPGGVVLGLAVAGTLVGLAGLAAFLAGRALGEGSAQTMAFATVALAELAFVFACRSESVHAWREPWNGALVGAALVSAAFVAAVVYAPFLNAPFATVPLGPLELAVVLVLALVPAAGAELAKALHRLPPAAPELWTTA